MDGWADSHEALTQALRGTFPDWLGLEITHASGDRVIATLVLEDRHKQAYGIVDGGVHASIVETVGSVGGGFNAPSGHVVVGVENSTDFFRPCHGGTLSIEGTPLFCEDSTQLWEVSIRLDGASDLLARGRLRLMHVEWARVAPRTDG